MTIVDSVSQQLGNQVVEAARELGWNDDASRHESALQFLCRMNYEKGVQDGAVVSIQEVGKYKRAVTLQRRVGQIQTQRIKSLETELATFQGGAAAAQTIRQGKVSGLNSEGNLSYKVKVEPPCRAEQVGEQMVCKCGNIWNPHSEFWPACKGQENGA